jgi:nitroreductase
VELREALRTTGSVRRFSAEPVSDETIYSILDDGRFAPSGGNRQAWRVVVVKDPDGRRSIASAYLDAWHDHVAHHLADLTPFSPLATNEERLAAATQRGAAEAKSDPDGFAETLADVPVLLVVLADLSVLAALDRDLDHYHIVGGASIYPFVWNILLAARERGIGGVMTTMAAKNEPTLQATLEVPETLIVAAVIALGYPEQPRPTKLSRQRVEEFATVDTLRGEPFRADG